MSLVGTTLMQGLYQHSKKLQKVGFLIETSEIYVLNAKKNQEGLKLQIIKIYHYIVAILYLELIEM